MAVSTESVAGIVAGKNPLTYSPSAPYTIFLYQSVVIILLCQVVHYPLKKLQQPKVIAEVVAGIILGPSVLGHVPGYTSNCFPPESIPGLTLLANIGIILFLFIIGLEVDISFIRKNLKVSMTVGFINMAIPFAFGCGIAKGMYNEYKNDSTTLGAPVTFTTYMVFIAVAMCITAFPVLARILTELNLIGDRVGTIVLAAGIVNDLTGWILLALVVTLANASNGVNVVYILLLTIGWFLFLCYPVRLALKFLLTKFTNELQTGYPSQLSMLLIIVCLFISAFFTDIIGVHPIFGAFMVGIIVPRDNGYVIKITEKLEDIVNIILIPIYFAIAGLHVNLGLLNNGIDWAYIVGIICLAMVGKVFGGFIAAKLNNLLWRESLAVGILMSCKGIVEIVVLNVGLSAGIISQRVYSMFIVMALVTTFATTPLGIWLYPVSYREWRDKFVRGEVDLQGNSICKGDHDPSECRLIEGRTRKLIQNYTIDNLNDYPMTKIVLVLRQIDTISYLMAFIKEFSNSFTTDIRAIHLREFSSRTSHLLEVSGNMDEDRGVVSDANQNEYTNSTSILHIVKAFSDLMNIDCSSKSILSTSKNHILSINDQIADLSDFVLTSSRLCQLSVDGIDYNLYSRLFKECKSHFGLLLLNYRTTNVGFRKFSRDAVMTLESIDQVTVYDDDTTEGLIDFKSLNFMISNDNVISSSDLLALHVMYKLINKKTFKINVFIKTGSNSSIPDQRMQDINLLLKQKNPEVVTTFTTVKDSFSKNIQKVNPQIANELFVVANNIQTNVIGGTNATTLFEPGLKELLDTSVAHLFHVLVVRAAS